MTGTPGAASAADASASITNILSEIETLEGKSDPKCYATASRLEDFMFGTPLSFDARDAKNRLQKELARRLWQTASDAARAADARELTAADIDTALSSYFRFSQDDDGHWRVALPGDRSIRINGTDKRQYSSIAYALRAILAVQQESLFDVDASLRPLGQGAIATLKDAIDVYTLSVLKVADGLAREQSAYEIDEPTIVGTWEELLGGETDAGLAAGLSADEEPAARAERRLADLALTNAIIDRKVRAYAAYNQVSNQLFVRNLQVYFAKKRWPADEDEARRFRSLFTESLIAMAAEIYKGAEAVALGRGNALIRERDVNDFLSTYIPYRVNEYEDVVFFPALARDERIVIEAYDMDAFRDSGIHWRYLQFATQTDGFEAYLEPDPFALELITENIAQLGVLILRVTGHVGDERGHERIAADDLTAALERIRTRVALNNAAPPRRAGEEGASLKSAAASTARNAGDGALYTDVTADVGIDFMHRSSDWLSRLLRSYLEKDENTGIITIPPAFGGSGIAVEDIDGDGHEDILILGGLGNRLYVHDGRGGFDDITVAAGLNWTRPEDRNPGEPRQPLIADLDNDGHQDIVITYVDDAHRVYRNNGDRTFTDVTDKAGLGGKGLVGGPATVFDFDNDGLLDVYITYFGNYLKGVLPTLERRNTNGLPNRLFKNLGDFEFADVTEGSGLDNSGWGQAVTHTDLDGDALQDVIVGNDFGVNAYYRNSGQGRFEDISARLDTDKPSYTMGIGIADLNGDLAPDIYISNIVTMNKDQKYVLPNEDTTMAFNPDKLANMRVVEANDLFLSVTAGDGIRYTMSRAVERGYSSTGWSWGAEFFDSDNDGDDDLYVLNGMNEFNLYSSENPYYTDPEDNARQNIYIPVSTKESNVFFVNDDGRLNNVSRDSGLDLLGNSRSAAYLDFDDDGDLDIVVNNYHEAARVYRNNHAADHNNWLKVKLVGDPENGVNRDAIGARLIVTTANGDTVWREIRGSSGYMTVQPKEQHFGLGASGEVRLEIVWPDGTRQVLPSVAANRGLLVRYGAAGPGEQAALK